MKRASMYSTILVAALAIGTAGPASAQSGSSAGAGGQSGSSGSSAGPAGQSGTTGTGSGQSGASAGQAGTSGAGDNTSVASGAQSGATSPRRDDRQDFIEKAAIANMAEIQLGQLASTNAQDPQVKQFAQMMVTEHTQALDQLRSAAGSATLPSSLDSKHQKLQDKLSKLHGAEFDRAYMDAMVDAHKDAEKLLSRRAGKSHDARGSDSSASGHSAMAGSAGSAGSGSSTSGSASGTAGTSGSGTTTSATGTSGAGTPSQSGDASGTVSGSTSGASASGAVGTSGSSSSYGSGASSTPGSVDEWAAMTLPKVKSHLEQARSLENQVKQQSKAGNSNGNSTQGAQPQQQ